MRKLAQTDTFKEQREKLNTYVMAAGNVTAFSLVLPDATYQGTQISIVGGYYRNSVERSSVFVDDAVLSLTPNADNYISLTRGQTTLQVTQTNISAHNVYTLYKITLNEFEEITNIVDYRTWLAV